MITCPILILWIAATGPVTGYELEVDSEVVSVSTVNAGEFCIEDSEPHTFQVFSLMEGERIAGNRVDGTIEQMISMGRNREAPERVELDLPGCPFPAAVCFDVTRTGVVSLADFGEFLAAFNTHNEGGREVVP